MKFLKQHGQIPKNILPQLTKKGFKFLNTFKMDYTEFFSVSIIQIKDQVYSFEYRPIILGIKEILQNQEIAQNCIFDYNEIYTSINVSIKYFIKNIILKYINLIFLFIRDIKNEFILNFTIVNGGVMHNNIFHLDTKF